MNSETLQTRTTKQGQTTKQTTILIAVPLLLASSWLATPVFAQVDKKDKTGTNPVNFTCDWRSYVEFQDLGDGDNSQAVFTVEQRFPIGDKYQFRFRARYNSLSMDPEEDGSSVETSGTGDWDARFLWVAEPMPILGRR